MLTKRVDKALLLTRFDWYTLCETIMVTMFVWDGQEKIPLFLRFQMAVMFWDKNSPIFLQIRSLPNTTYRTIPLKLYGGFLRD